MIDLPPCVDDIASHYRVPIELIQAVSIKEGGKLGSKIGPNSNGTYDLGPMQINTWWLEKGNRPLKPMGITEFSLRYNICQNFAVGVWILSMNLDRYGDLTRALSSYNTGHPNNTSYPAGVMKILSRLQSTK